MRAHPGVIAPLFLLASVSSLSPALAANSPVARRPCLSSSAPYDWGQATTPLEQRYWALVQRYLQHDSRVIEEILGWKDSDVRKMADTLSRLTVRGRAMSPGEVTARLKAAAIMMHTDAGLTEFDRGKTESVHLQVALRIMHDSEVAPHTLAAVNPPSPFSANDSSLREFSFRNWVLAVAESLVEQMAYEPARSLLGQFTAGGGGGSSRAYRGLIDGTDRDIVFIAGWLEESAAFSEGQVPASGAAAGRASREIETTPYMSGRQEAAREGLRAREERARAEKLYRRVLRLDDRYLEARLRLGRVLFDEGELAEAGTELQRVLAESSEPKQRYLAALFLGGLREKEGNIDGAIGFYSKALAGEPRSQTARVALAAALESTGRSAEARATIARLAEWRTTDGGFTDPWSGYVLGDRDSDLLAQLRAAVVTQ